MWSAINGYFVDHCVYAYFIHNLKQLNIFCARSQKIPVSVAAEVPDLNNRSVSPTAGHKGPEPPDDEDEGVGEEGDHDEEYRRQTEEVDMCYSLKHQ
jgi:hypothetical protein